VSSIGTRRLPATEYNFAELFNGKFKFGAEIGKMLDDALRRAAYVSLGDPRIHAHLHKGGDDTVMYGTVPVALRIGLAASAGTSTVGASPGDHVHSVDGLHPQAMSRISLRF